MTALVVILAIVAVVSLATLTGFIILTERLKKRVRKLEKEKVTITLVPIPKPTPYNPTMPAIERVTFSDPATVVFWADGSKTVVKCQKEVGDTYSKETGLAMALVKKAYGNKSSFNDIFTRWLAEDK